MTSKIWLIGEICHCLKDAQATSTLHRKMAPKNDTKTLQTHSFTWQQQLLSLVIYLKCCQNINTTLFFGSFLIKKDYWIIHIHFDSRPWGQISLHSCLFNATAIDILLFSQLKPIQGAEIVLSIQFYVMQLPNHSKFTIIFSWNIGPRVIYPKV